MAANLLRRGAGLRILDSNRLMRRWLPTVNKHLTPKVGVSSKQECCGYNTISTAIPNNAKVVICGGGVIGTSVAYHLAERGWKDIVLLEQGRLTCGTTWHSVGLIGQVRDTMAYTKLMKYSRQLYIDLENKHGVGWKQCGSISLAQTNDRFIHLKRNHAIAAASDIESRIITPSEIGDLCGHIITDDIVDMIRILTNKESPHILVFTGGLWIPGDGVLTAPDLVSALALEAKQKGVQIVEGVQINRIHTENGKVSHVETSNGPIQCEVFVNCAGQWARDLGLKTDPQVKIPLQPMEHFYVVTTPVQGIERMMPVIRDYDGDIFSREWSGGLMSGGFERKGKPAFPGGIPDKFEFQLFPEDWNHFQILMDSIMKRFPLMKTAQIRQQVNGPESFSPDANWSVGEVPNIKNYFAAAGMTSFGVAGAGAVGRHLSELIVDGHASIDLPAVDIKRHSDHHNGENFLRERGSEAIGRYQISYPGKQWVTGRNLEVSPLHSQMENAGALFGQDCAFEKPLWFNKQTEKSHDQQTLPRGTFGKPVWFDRVKAEYTACKQTVGLIDVSSFSQVEVWSKEDEAYNYLQYLCSGSISKETNRVTVTGMQNIRGGYECHCLVVPQACNRFFIFTPSTQKTRMIHWLQRHSSETVQIKDVTSGYCRLLLLGPYAEYLLNEVCSASVNNLHVKNSRAVTDIGFSTGTQIISQTWCGEVGFLLMIPSQCSLQVYNMLMDAGQKHGIQNVGHNALKQLQVENFYPQWIQELGANITPFEAGLSEFIDLDKNFIGRDALLEKKETALPKQMVQLAVDNFLPDKNMWVWGGEPVHCGDSCVGAVSSAGYSFNNNTMYCLAYLTQTLDAQNTPSTCIVDKDAIYEISVSGEIYKAKLTSTCPSM